MKSNPMNVVAVVLAIGLVVGFWAMAAQTGTGAQEIVITDDNNIRTVSVTGTAKQSVSPDEAEIRFSVVTEESTADEAGQKNADSSDALVRILKKYGKVETQSYSLNPVYDYGYRDEDRDLTIQFYRAQNTVVLTTDKLDEIGEAIDEATKSGSNRINGVNFKLSDELREQVQVELLEEAGKNANEKAKSIASGVGVGLGDVRSISSSAVNFPYPRYFAMGADFAMEESAVASKTPIEASDVEVSASISVSYELK